MENSFTAVGTIKIHAVMFIFAKFLQVNIIFQVTNFLFNGYLSPFISYNWYRSIAENLCSASPGSSIIFYQMRK